MRIGAVAVCPECSAEFSYVSLGRVFESAQARCLFYAEDAHRCPNGHWVVQPETGDPRLVDVELTSQYERFWELRVHGSIADVEAFLPTTRGALAEHARELLLFLKYPGG